MVWKAVVGYEGLYVVNHLGVIRSLPRWVTRGTGAAVRLKGKTLTRSYTHGYPQVTLSMGGLCRTVKVHNVVAAAFIGPKPTGKVVRHLDGDRNNARAKNIVYGTHQENSNDMRSHGTVLEGEASKVAKLTEEQVLSIRKLLATKNNCQISEMFGMSNQQISNIRLGRSWTSLKRGEP